MTCDPYTLATRGVQGLRPYEPGKPLEELAREYGITDAVKLASNENPLGPSPLAVAAAHDVLLGVARYPDGNGFRLKAALSEKLGVPEEQITLGNGSNDLLELLARAFVAPDQEVVFSAHAFAVYPIATQAVGGRAVVVPARQWGSDPEAMADAVTANTRLVFIANPNNPTGTWLTAGALKVLLDRVPDHVIVALDEAYSEYVEDPQYPDGLRLLARYPNLVVTRTFSKIYGLAGLRVGYSLSSPAIAEILNRVRQPFNVNSVAQAAAVAALADADHLRLAVELNRAGLRQLIDGFDDLGLEYIPSVGNFISVDVGRDGLEVYDGLLHHGVIVRPIANYGMPRHLRVTVGTEKENTRFLEALQQVLAGR